jgi:hypothetical protein
MATKLINGINPKCSNEDYHADREYKSSSALKMILKDPRQFYYTYVENEEQAPRNMNAMNLGSYVHALILEPEIIEDEFAIYNGAVKRGAAWEQFKAENSHKIIISKSQANLAHSMVNSFEEAEIQLGEEMVQIASFFQKGDAEETMCAEIDGYKVKARFDYRKIFGDFGSINDVKTTSEPIFLAPKSKLEEICAQWDYDISAALYVDVAQTVTGIRHDFYFCFISKADHGVRMVKASQQMIETGRKKYKQAIKLLKIAEETGIYFENKIEEIDAINV